MFAGKRAPNEVQTSPLDWASGEDSLRQAVGKAESFCIRSGVDITIHNAAPECPVS
ncbi:uncharacterized protein J3R85_012335 [Psidium guajava]|nr:uncharacterized protein J3R85_012335 [Psidium guajava]